MNVRATISTALLALSCGAMLLAAENREDVIYLQDATQPALRLKAMHRTPVCFSPDSASILGYLAEGQPAEVLGVGETRHYVSARVATGPVKGWVDAQAMEAPPADFVAKLQARHERIQSHQGMIERHKVAVGMSRAEVRASLGKPDRTAQVRTREGNEEQWFYVIYQYIPFYTRDNDADGNPRQQVSYHRQASGRRVITFQKDEVVEVADQQEEKPQRPTITVLPGRPIN